MITTDRLVLRPFAPADRVAYVALLTSPVACAHLGGARPPEDAEAAWSHAREDPGGSHAVADRESGSFLGVVGLSRRAAERPGHIGSEGLELEVSYLLLPDHWGNGLAEEAVRGLLADAAVRWEDQPVLVVTQAANVRSVALVERLGFVERMRFTEFDAVQVLAVAALATFVPD